MLTLSVIEKIEKLEAEHKVMTDKAELDEKAVEMLDHNLDEVVIRAGNLEISVRKAKEEAAAQKLALETYIRATAQRRQNFLDDLEK
jgi:t-SNARE complex subunit (syntaxin)